KVQQESGSLYHTVLRCKIEQPQARTEDLARQVSERLGKSVSAGSLRVTLHRARQRFAELLLAEVAHSLETSDPQQLEDELIELGLLEYCRSALERRGPPA